MTNSAKAHQHPLLEPLKRLHEIIRSKVVDSCEASTTEAMSAVAREEEGDTIYAVDKISEKLLIDFFAREIASRWPLVLIAEGLPGGSLTLPEGTRADQAEWRIICDPIDGTRGLMYQKRSGWILTGVARNRGVDTNLADIELAIQTEIPLIKQNLSDRLWATRRGGAHAERQDRITGEVSSINLRPSQARTIAHGYAQISRFFPGAREELAAIDEEIVAAALGPVMPGKAHCFEDQYASTAGQLYELMNGHDRFTADLRPLMEAAAGKRGGPLGICCHPYDLCTELIAREAGVIVTDVRGDQLRTPLNIEENVAWAGYANVDVRRQVQPLLQAALSRRGLI